MNLSWVARHKATGLANGFLCMEFLLLFFACVMTRSHVRRDAERGGRSTGAPSSHPQPLDGTENHPTSCDSWMKVVFVGRYKCPRLATRDACVGHGLPAKQLAWSSPK